MTWFQFKASDPHKRMVLQTAQDTHRALRHLINKAQLTGKLKNYQNSLVPLQMT